EFPMAQIYDFRNVAGFEETVKKPYLTARIADARDGDMTRQEVRQSGRLISKIESRDRARVRHVVLGEKPRQHGLADLPVRRAHDINGRRHAPGRFRRWSGGRVAAIDDGGIHAQPHSPTPPSSACA